MKDEVGMTNDQGPMPKKVIASLFLVPCSLSLLHPSSFILHPSSFILHPSSLILLVWVFALGGVVGSFLNVVIYRLPRGMSLVQPGSHCPACKRPIRWRDNLPILGWFLLRGRCRDCKAKIALRYPMVEAISAVVFLLVAAADGFFEAMMPRGPLIDSLQGMGTTHRTETCVLVAYHLVLLCTLFAAGLIEYDGHRVPLRVALPALIVGALAPLAWPSLHPALDCFGWPAWIAAMADAAAGFAVGGLWGLLVWWSDRPRDRVGLLVGPACAGLFLGWQAAVVLGLLIAVLHPASRLVGHKWPAVQRLSPNLLLAAATIAWIFT
jgi:leader peptidase (prepilin peptidase)/N-methyltransferase